MRNFKFKMCLLEKTLAFAAASFMMFTISCSRPSSSKLQDASAFNPPPKPGETDTIEAQLSRYEGQTSFLNPMNTYFSRSLPADQNRDGEKIIGSAQRAIQESDIFKIGKEGSKVLFLLNNYRGLQIVSYENGPADPRIIGRVAATGNWPDDMYYQAETDTILVLERVWYDDSGRFSYNSERNSRIVIYDVSDLKSPKIRETVPFTGEMADSRIVGNVLYIAASVYPTSQTYWDENHTNTEESKGLIYSFRIKASGIEKVAEQTLTLPVNGRENMNIVEVREGDLFKYYLVAVLSKSRWDWWERTSAIEIIDISDADGVIKPVMIANAKGQVRERSTTHIKNNTLIVTSNYWPQNNPDLKMRVAVETFNFPTDHAPVVDVKEAEYRRLWLDRELNKAKKHLSETLSGDALDEAIDKSRAELIKDQENGIQGVFERADNGSLRKMISDSVITVGDTQGLNASLQDVRYSDNKLYVFWVPQNFIDPLDIFDISTPEKGVTYLGRTEFEGWVQRSIPINYKGRELILGLGWVIPSIDNESEKRYPQALLFEIITMSTMTGLKVKAEPVAQISLKNSQLWTNFNDRDKFVELRMSGEGQGTILFQVQTYINNQYITGGKFIGFDFKKATDETPEKIFSEGGLLVGNQGWLRRVFNNPEIEKVNTFSDEALGTFSIDGYVGGPNDIVNAIHVLELARNIVAYTSTSTTPIRGIQFISNQDWYSSEPDAKTTLRLVSSERADTEKSEIISEATLSGNYKSHFTTSDGLLAVLTTSSRTEKIENEDYRYRYIDTTNFALLKISGERVDKIDVVSSTTWEKERKDNSGSFFPSSYSSDSPIVTELSKGNFLVLSGTNLNLISINTEPSASSVVLDRQDINLNDCPLEGKHNVSFKLFDGTIYLNFAEKVDDPTRKNLSFERNLISPLTIDFSTHQATCKQPINIPGQVVSVIRNGSQIVTDDTRVVDIIEKRWGDQKEHVYYSPVVENSLASLKVNMKDAVLRDQYDRKGLNAYGMKTLGTNSFFFFQQEESQWYRPYNRYDRQENHTFVKLIVNDEGKFLKEMSLLSLEDGDHATLAKVLIRQDGSYLGVVTVGRKLQVITWKESSFNPNIVKISLVNERFERQIAENSLVLPDPYSLYGYGSVSRDAINFTASQNSLEVAQSLHGVMQFFIVE